MKILKIITCAILLTMQFNCISQVDDNKNLLKKDIEITHIYKKFYENRLDYGDKKGEARDTILNRFKNTLIKTLSNNKTANFSFDSLANTIKIIKSEDNKLKIFSWNEYNGGTWHVYNSAYQYNNKDKSYSGILSLDYNKPYNGELHTDITHFKINTIKKDNKYLVKGYGTHGGGKEFFVYRLLSFKNGEIKDCSGCFDGKDRFVYEISRGDKLEPKYNDITKEILYHELKESYIQGNKDEPSGFMESTGKILKLKYKEGYFIKIDN